MNGFKPNGPMGVLVGAMLVVGALAGPELAANAYGTCAAWGGDVKCWGLPEYVDPAYVEGDSTTAVTVPPATSFDLGSVDGDFTVKQVISGNQLRCAVSTEGTARCWGDPIFGLGYGNVLHFSDAANFGLNIEFASGFVIESGACGGHHCCMISADHLVQCFGANGNGQLGYGDTNIRGDEPDEMGDYLEFVDFGGDFVPMQIAPGSTHTCALSTTHTVKCFGRATWGELFSGDTENKGDDPDEMGDFLSELDLGTNFDPVHIESGGYTSCVLGNEGQLKCWGLCSYGACGVEGSVAAWGVAPEELGDNLPTVNLGSDFGQIAEMFMGWFHTCVSNTEGRAKCYGDSRSGQLGNGNNDNLGRDENTMGDYLAYLDLGSDFAISYFSVSGGTPWQTCAVSTENEVKCWGNNKHGQLGIGDTVYRGDQAGQMGDSLPYLNLSWPMTTMCDAAEMYGVDWHELLNEDAEDALLLHDYSVDFDSSTLSLTLGATLEYVGLSADGNFDESFNLGTTYWIDLQSFTALGDGHGVDSAGTCANRQSSDYDALDFDNFFGFTTNPMDLESVSTSERMAYPPSNWTLTASSCNVVEYEKTFSWTELTACADADGNALVSVTETDDSVLLEGTFFVELVSPYSMSSDEYYRSFPLIQQDFGVALMRTVNVLSSANTQLFIASVMGYGRHDDDGSYEVTVLIQSADYVQLLMDDLVSISAISAPDGVTVTGIEVENSECLVASSFTCGQIFKVAVTAECSGPEPQRVDLSGNYQFAFTPDCQTLDDGTTDPACETFLGTLDDTDGKVVLDVDVSYVDYCDVSLFEVAFGAEMAFYSDAVFAEEVDGESDPFVIGQDTIYGKVVVDIPDESGESFAFIDVEIEAVYVCTAEDTALLSLDSDTGLGGCLSSYIDADGPYKVIGTGFDSKYQGNTTFDVAANNEAGFSFLTFDAPRETINVHVQLLMTMEAQSGERRRMRMLLQSGDGAEANAFKSYLDTASVQEADTTDAPLETDAAATFSVAFMPAMFAVIGWMMLN